MSTALDAMRAALGEITALRRRNEVLEAKVEVMDLFAATLHGQAASRVQGMGHPDPAWLLARAIAELEKPDEAPAPGKDDGGSA